MELRFHPVRLAGAALSRFRLELKTFDIPFRMRFTHASASRARACSVICVAHGEDGIQGFGEGCPRDYVTAETIETAAAFFTANRENIEKNVRELASLRDWMDRNQETIDANPSAFAATEIALIDLFARRSRQTIETFLGLPDTQPVPVSPVFGVTGTAATALLAIGYRLFGMTDAKVKLSSDPAADRGRIRIIRRILGPSMRLRVDANNLFDDADACAQHLDDVDSDIWAIEEPLRPDDVNGQNRLAALTGARIILDESAVRPADLRKLEGDHWIVNLRISKLGGLLRSLEMLKTARANGYGVIIGSHVGETSLLARCALLLASACEDCLVTTECGYSAYLLQRDIGSPKICFNRRGILDAGRAVSSGRAGTGIAVDQSLLGPLVA